MAPMPGVRVTVDRAAALAHLTDLYGGADAGYLALWTPTGARSSETHWFSVEHLEAASDTAIALADAGRNVYAGVGLQHRPLGRFARGTSATVVAVPGLYVDVDIAGPAHTAQNLPPTYKAARLLLADGFSLPPTSVIDSGHGLQAFWLFREPFWIDDEAERELVASLNRRLQRMIRATARAEGWTVDPTADLARVLRVPGTINRKPNLPPAPVRSLERIDARYLLDDLDARLPDAIEQEPRRTGQPGDGVRGEDGRPDARLIFSACAYLRRWRDDAATLSEPEWHAGMSIAALCADGERLAHECSAPHPGYNRDQTQRKFERARTAVKPMTCDTIRRDRGGEEWCQHCPLPGWITSPIDLGCRHAGVTVRGHSISASTSQKPGTSHETSDPPSRHRTPDCVGVGGVRLVTVRVGR